MFKIAIDAGHGMNTPGKRCLKTLDAKETREWYLNDRIADKIEKKLASYDGYQLIRVDDTTGKTDVALKTRVNKANEFEADICVSIHHNAHDPKSIGQNGGSGSGVIVIVYTKASQKSKEYQKIIYDELIKETGLKGNRSNPMPTQNLYVCRETEMPCVLAECGFMDSVTDTKIILTEDFADKAAEAFVNALVEIGNLKKKSETPKDTSGKLYRVQVGCYSKRENAEAMKKKLMADGYDAIIV